MKKIIISAVLLTAMSLGAKTPNIIYILADDLGIGELSCYGQKKMQTPNIDKIATEGMQFSRHYSGSTVCAPSRCTLMTGLHTGHAAIRDNLKSPIEGAVGSMHMSEEGTYTVAQMLKDKGYKTGIFGKWGLGAQESPTAPLKAGFDRFFGYNDQAHAHRYFTEYLWDDNEKITYEGNDEKTKLDYSADTIHAEVMKYIDENKDKPFFIYYATTLPHADVISIEKYQAQFRGKFLPEESFKGGAAYVAQPETHAAFAAMVYALDYYVGDIFKKLEDEGILDNTIVIFSSDNGTHLEGGHNPKYWESTGGLRGNKREFYEGGIRAPMLVYWKDKVAAGSQTSHISAFWDVLPTLAEIVDAKIPENLELDGISFLPTLLGEDTQKEHDYLYWEFKSGDKKALLQGDWKLVVLNVSKGPKYQLYNLAKDRGEKNDVSAQNPEKLKEMKELLRKARTTPQIKGFEFKAGSAQSGNNKKSKKSKKK